MSSTPIRVLAVDDHAFVVEGLKARLEIEPDIEFIGRLDCVDTLEEEVKRLRPDIVLLDINIPGGDSFEAAADLGRHCPKTRVIMLSGYVRDHYIDSAHDAGTWGYLTKGDSSENVINGIRDVARGEPAFSEEIRGRASKRAREQRKLAPTSRLNLLTTRESQILRMIAKGMSRLEIAEALSRSPMTVDNHRKSIMKKLEISDRVELTRYAIGEGLVEV